MERAVDVRARVRDHGDLADVELGLAAVVRARLRAAQMIADDRRRQALVGDHAVFDRVTEIDQLHCAVHGITSGSLVRRHHRKEAGGHQAWVAGFAGALPGVQALRGSGGPTWGGRASAIRSADRSNGWQALRGGGPGVTGVSGSVQSWFRPAANRRAAAPAKCRSARSPQSLNPRRRTRYVVV